MKGRFFLYANFILWNLNGIAVCATEQIASSHTWSLGRCFEYALANSETLLIREDDIQKAEYQLAQTIGKMLPKLSFQHDTEWQDRRNASTDSSAFASSLTQSPIRNSYFKLTLPLLTGYRELAAIRGGGALVHQKEHEKKRVELLLFNDIASAYFAVVGAEQNLKTNKNITELAKERLNELKTREQVGRSRRAEILDVEAEIATLMAERQDILKSMRTGRNLLTFLVGTPISAPLQTPLMALHPMPLENYLALLEDHSELRTKKEAVSIAKQTIKTSRSGHFPGLEVNGNYYTSRDGFQSSTNWDVTLGINVPLWSWGTVIHETLAAQASLNQAILEEQLSKRQLTQKVEDAYAETSFSLEKLKLQHKAVELTQKSFDTRILEYRHGLVSNFEVLNALDKLYQAKQALISTKLQSILAVLQLETTAGRLPYLH